MMTLDQQLIPALIKHCDTHRLVSTGALTLLQISELRARGLMFVDSETSLGFALVPWEWATIKDIQRDIPMKASEP